MATTTKAPATPTERVMRAATDISRDQGANEQEQLAGLLMAAAVCATPQAHITDEEFARAARHAYLRVQKTLREKGGH